MSISMRLSRGGSKKRPYYKIVVANSRAPRDGKYLEQIGTYNPLLAKDSGERVKINEERAKHWLSVGAQPTDRVARFLDAAGLKERKATVNPKKGEPGEKAKERAEEKAPSWLKPKKPPRPLPKLRLLKKLRPKKLLPNRLKADRLSRSGPVRPLRFRFCNV